MAGRNQDTADRHDPGKRFAQLLAQDQCICTLDRLKPDPAPILGPHAVIWGAAENLLSDLDLHRFGVIADLPRSQNTSIALAGENLIIWRQGLDGNITTGGGDQGARH